MISLMKAPMFMRAFLLTVLGATLSCQKQKDEITVTEQRELTMFDEKLPSNIIDEPADTWRQIPSTDFRLLNYLGGEKENVEIFIGVSGGGLLGNANRWMGQFGQAEVSSEDELTQVSIPWGNGVHAGSEGDVLFRNG